MTKKVTVDGLTIDEDSDLFKRALHDERLRAEMASLEENIDDLVQEADDFLDQEEQNGAG